MERLKHPQKEKAASLDIKTTKEASNYLKRLILRPNPRLAEFAFLCIGQENLISKILVANKKYYSRNSGLYSSSQNSWGTSVDGKELIKLGHILQKQAEKKDVHFVVFGHTHPSGEVRSGQDLINIKPSDLLLSPSMGSPEDGGPTWGRDLYVAKLLYKMIPSPAIYFGIAANTQVGPKFRIYETKGLAKIKRYNDIDKVPQITIKL